jgi:TonB family protein
MRNVKLLSILLAALLIVACTKHRITVAAKPPVTSSSHVSFKFLSDKDSDGKQDPNGWEYHPPHLTGEAEMPSYPERPLAKQFGTAVVVVRIAINSAGEVTNVSPEPGSTTGPFAVDFFRAVETAIRKWRFTPPEWWLLEEVSGNGKTDYQRVIDRKPATASGDAEFLFELVGGQGKVTER